MGTHQLPQVPLDIVVCCDGTWCGDSTNTRTNIKLIAEAFAGGVHDAPNNLRPQDGAQDGHRFYEPANRPLRVAYFDGLGDDRGPLAGYMLDGATAMNIEKACVEAYQYIAANFTTGSRVWLFGLSRGAFTVRCVAGMINCCGILDPARLGINPQLEEACKQVYAIYRDRDPKYHPNGGFCKEFRLARSHVCEYPPIRFMGLLDTVGALGLPHLDVGQYLGYELYDQNVSSEVQTVCQALATHDRLGPFTPCFVRRKRADVASGQPVPYKGQGAVTYLTEEVWFPGSHYDIGRQRFVLFRNNGDVLESGLHYLQAKTNFLHINLNFTKELADPPLQYLLTRVQETVRQDRLPNLLPYRLENGADHGPYYVPTEDDEKPPRIWRLPGPLAPLSIDAYDKVAEGLASSLLRRVPVGGDLVQIIVQNQLLHDRHIPLYRAHPAHAQAQQAALQLGLQEVQHLQPPLAVDAVQLQGLQVQQADGNAVRYFYSPQGNGRNLEFPAVAGWDHTPFHSKSFQAFRRLAMAGEVRYVGANFQPHANQAN